MPTAVQMRRDSAPNDLDTVWITSPVHGNSKRLCEIHRNREECGARAMFETTMRSQAVRTRLSNKGLLPIFHCDDPRHIANAHKQITELDKIL